MTNPNVGFATLSIIPSARGFQAALGRELGGPLDTEARRAGDKAGGSFMGGFSSFAKAGALAAGVAIGATVAAGFNQALSQEADADRIAASFGLDPASQERLGKVAGSLYADAYGDSFGQVNEAVIAVERQLGALGGDELNDLTENALDFANVFGVDVTEGISKASFLLENELASSGEQAFDILTDTLQRVPATVRGEVLDAAEEYSTFFADLGLSGVEAFDLIASAAERGGRFGVDKVADALKELTDRGTDLTEPIVAAYDAIGISAEDSATKLASGGKTARGALDDIVQGLLGIEDPAARQRAAIELFGEPIVDLSSSEIPTFLDQLANMGDGLGDVEGKADGLASANDNLSTKIEAFKRGALQELSDFITDPVLPALEEFGDWAGEHVLPALEDVGAFIVDELVPAGTELYTGIAEEMLPALEDLWATIDEDLLPALEDLWETYSNDILPVQQEVYEFLVRNLIPIISWLAEVTAIAIGLALDEWNKLKENVETFVGTVDRTVSSAKETLDGLVGFVTGLPGRITSAAAGMWNGISSGFLGVVNSVIGAWNAIDFGINLTVPSWIPRIGGNSWRVDDIVPDIPLVGGGGSGTGFLPGSRRIPVAHDGATMDFGGPGREGLALLLHGERVLSPAETEEYERAGGSRAGTILHDDIILDGEVIGRQMRRIVHDEWGSKELALTGRGDR